MSASNKTTATHVSRVMRLPPTDSGTFFLEQTGTRFSNSLGGHPIAAELYIPRPRHVKDCLHLVPLRKAIDVLRSKLMDELSNVFPRRTE